MKPVIALIGRPNVGKSTLFNRLTGERDAIVADIPGVTRDRQYGSVSIDGRSIFIVDTGGITEAFDPAKSTNKSSLEDHLRTQTHHAVVESDAVLFMVDARDGVLPVDKELANELRQLDKPVALVINKAEGLAAELIKSEFFELGIRSMHVVSAKRGDGVRAMLREIVSPFPEDNEAAEEVDDEVRVSIIGRPNAGKSTFINSVIGSDRVVVSEVPGTTRDSIRIPVSVKGREYTLIDTAGVRKRARVKESLEKFSVVKTLQAIEQANVVLLMIDGSDGLSDQDATLAGFVLEEGRALVLAINKVDKMDKDRIAWMRQEIERRFPYLAFAKLHFISAKNATGLAGVFRSIDKAYQSACKTLSTGNLNRQLARAIEKTAPPMVHGRRIKLKFAHQGGKNPPRIIIHGNQVDSVPDSYRRYLANSFRTAFGLEGTPVVIEFRSGENPYKGKKSVSKKRSRKHKKQRK